MLPSYNCQRADGGTDDFVGRTPWSAADAPVGLLGIAAPLLGGAGISAGALGVEKIVAARNKSKI
ncbi:MAG TPA: hypothetical protein VEU96_22470 [Bryobacteraceae bacterium]|nr:hypothetical protein [Bryobacteraceae bacterium]